ncbi:MAG: hypothetical protein HC767_08330 [Akkermansiaceae bacterium]|nr:hypothetical protein [Akkermansiaceae bacterium]
MSGDTTAVLDKKRGARVGLHLNAREWELLKDALVSYTYTDSHSNQRRFSTLQKFRDWLPHKARDTTNASVQADTQALLNELEQARENSRARTWDGLQNTVIRLFDLRRVKENFKVHRN